MTISLTDLLKKDEFKWFNRANEPFMLLKHVLA